MKNLSKRLLNRWSLIAVIMLLSMISLNFDFNGCLCDSDDDLGNIVPTDEDAIEGTVFDSSVEVDLPDDVDLVFPSALTFNDVMPASLLATDAQISVPDPNNPGQVISIASDFAIFDEGGFSGNIGQNFTKLINKMLYSVGEFADDLLARVKEKFPDLKVAEGDWVTANIPYIENDLNIKTIVKLERPGDGTYELTLGLGTLTMGSYSLDLNLFKMKWQPNSNFKFKGYVIINTKLINYVLEAAAAGFKLPFDYARFDFDFQAAVPGIEIWLAGIADLPDDIPALLKFKAARIGMEKLPAGLRVRTTFQGLVQPSWLGVVNSLTGVSMTDPKLKFVAYAEWAGEGGLAAKFEDYGLAGETPILKKDLLLTVNAGARFYFNSGSGSMGIELEVANPVIRYGTWETSFGSILTWVCDEILGVDNWLSSQISAVTTGRITEQNFYSSAIPEDPSEFWSPFLVSY